MSRALRIPGGSRIAAITILVAMLAAVWLTVVGPLWDAWTNDTDEAERLSDLVAHLRRSAAEAPVLQAQLQDIGKSQRDHSAIMLAATPNLAGVNLQSELRQITESHGAQLRSVQQLPPVSEAELNRVSVRADLQTETTQLSKILFDIERHSPVFLVRRLSVRGSEQQSSQSILRPTQLTVEIELSALTGTPE